MGYVRRSSCPKRGHDLTERLKHAATTPPPVPRYLPAASRPLPLRSWSPCYLPAVDPAACQQQYWRAFVVCVAPSWGPRHEWWHRYSSTASAVPAPADKPRATKGGYQPLGIADRYQERARRYPPMLLPPAKRQSERATKHLHQNGPPDPAHGVWSPRR